MRAIVYHEYGKPDVLSTEERDTPTPADEEVLIRVHAASVNSWDWDLLRGTPFMNRAGGLLHPRYEVLGGDVAGRIETVGPKVTGFRRGDEVFADVSQDGWGCFAEYVCASEKTLAIKPADVTFEQAAAAPEAGVLALQGLRKAGPIAPGHKVLINGAGGGVGTFAVQMAKQAGAEVTGVDRGAKLHTVRALGADIVIDYTLEDFPKRRAHYDLILDTQGQHSIFDCRGALSPEGRYVMVGGSTPRVLQTLLLGPLVSLVGDMKMGALMHRPNGADLSAVGELIADRSVVPVIDSRYSLDMVPDALAHFGEGQVIGKVIITVLKR